MVSIINSKWPSPEILTGGQPTIDELKQAQQAGFKTIINLRGDGEAGVDTEPDVVNELGMAYHHIPINGASGTTFENADDFGRLLAEASRPVMVHCASGNRVGALFALKAFKIDGMSPQEALDEGYKAGLTGLEGLVRQLVGL